MMTNTKPPDPDTWNPSIEDFDPLSQMPLYVLARRFVEAASFPEPGPALWSLAADTLQNEQGEIVEATLGRLAREIQASIQALRNALTPLDAAFDALDLSDDLEGQLCAAAGTDAPDGELLELDRLGAAYLASLGAEGKRRADKILEKSRERWTAWKDYKAAWAAGGWKERLPEIVARGAHPPLISVPPPWDSAWTVDPGGRPGSCPDLLHLWRDQTFIFSGGRNHFPPGRYFKHLAAAVWLDLVKPRLEREARFSVPTLARPVARAVIGVLGPDTASYPAGGGQLVLESERIGGRVLGSARVEALARRFKLPLADTEAVRMVLDQKIKALRTPTGIRTFCHLVAVAHEKMTIGQEPAPASWEVAGGLAIAARQIGLGSKQDPDIMRDTLDALASILLPIAGDLDTGHVPLINWTYAPAWGRNPGFVRVDLYEPMAGGYLFKLQGKDRNLTPVPQLPPPNSPVYVGDRSTRAAQAVFHLELNQYMAEHSGDIAKRGGVEIRDKNWQELADLAGLPRRLLADLIRAYLGSLFPVLRCLDSGLYLPADKATADFLAEQGRRKEAQSERGKRGARTRAAGGGKAKAKKE
jgi:hypothetical protein